MIYKISLLSFFLILFSIKSISQCTGNYLLNPSFETPLQTGNTNGNNFPGINPWGSWSMPGLGSNAFNVIRVNGSGYGGGPNNAQQGVQYIDINSNSGTLTQNFTLGCTADITFSGWFSSREISGYVNWTASIEIINSSNVVVATSSTRLFTVADADNNPGDAIWYQLTGSALNLPSGNYTFRVNLGNYGNFDNAFLCASPGCLLPAKLISFSGEHTSTGNLLRWKIADQLNLAKFTVERSINGAVFTSVDDIVPVNSLESDFTYLDKFTPPARVWYYRLKMTDNDGSYKFSSIIKIENNLQQPISLSVYPNPVTGGDVNIFIQSAERHELANLYLTDITGRQLSQKMVRLERGINNFIINRPSPHAGIYLLHLAIPGRQISLKINIH